MNPEFEAFYLQQFGERWQQLRLAMREQERKVSWNNRFTKAFNGTSFSTWSTQDKAIERDADGLLQSYVLDPASAVVGLLMKSESPGVYLDMCAAPGGKSLVMIGQGEGRMELVANEPSPGRRENLFKVIRQYLPESVRFKVTISGKQGLQWGVKAPNKFTGILIDAPCSGERHLLHNSSELKKWTPSRTRRLAHQQYALVCSGLLALREGGQLIYSTCALSHAENDAVIEKVLTKKGKFLRIDEHLPEVATRFIAQFNLQIERTRFGYAILPDKSQGAGPIYFSQFVRESGDEEIQVDAKS